MQRRTTLKEVAAHAGVSYQTVSKVLNRQGQVSSETEARIWESVRALGYRPNSLARNLRSQQSHMIGYSWAPSSPEQVNPILDQFLQSMAQSAESAGYHLLAFPHRSGGEWIAAYAELIDTNRVDGFVISSVEYDDSRIAFLMERNFPFVAFGRSNPELNFPYVDVDGAAGMQAIVEHLLSLGHRRLAVLAWPSTSCAGQHRMQGFLAALQGAGISTPDTWIARGEGSYAFGFQATKRWLKEDEARRPTAIVAFNDLMAIGAIDAAQDAGMRVGIDFAITGFDDAPLTQYLNPPLTSVRQPVWKIGREVMHLLLKLLQAGELTPEEAQILLTPQLIVRSSSQPLISKSRELG